MGAGFWYIYCAEDVKMTIPLTSRKPWDEVAALKRKYGPECVSVNSKGTSAQVLAFHRVTGPDAPSDALDTGLTSFMSFMSRFHEAVQPFVPWFAWPTSSDFYRGCEIDKDLDVSAVNSTLACWDAAMAAVFEDLLTEFKGNETLLKFLQLGPEACCEDEISAAYALQWPDGGRHDGLTCYHLLNMHSHLRNVRRVFEYASKHDKHVSIHMSCD